MVQHHSWNLNELENLYPYERDIYVSLLKEHLDKLEKKSQSDK